MRTTRIMFASVSAAVALCIGVAPAKAELVTWFFQDAVFDDGGTLSGSFTIDRDAFDPFDPAGYITELELTTTEGSNPTVFPGQTYSFFIDPGAAGGFALAAVTIDPANDLSGIPNLNVIFEETLNTDTTRIDVDIENPFISLIQEESFCSTVEPTCLLTDGDSRQLVSGFITTDPAIIPLPATLPLLLGGVGALVYLRRRRAV
ncbi:MAG: VPLPA-CTERM sorting domain-containing protein [Paracoccaceae bacterium]